VPHTMLVVGGKAGLRSRLPDQVVSSCYQAAWKSTLYQGRTEQHAVEPNSQCTAFSALVRCRSLQALSHGSSCSFSYDSRCKTQAVRPLEE
jgi:hypothetical protein